jgi:O-antigen/teichoic acid export membrane protein
LDADTKKDAVICRRVLRGTVSNYVGKVIGLGTWFILTPFILHQLGATQYALWVLVGSIVGYGSLLDMGITDAVIKYVAEYRAKGDAERASNLVATAFSIYIFFSLLVIVVSFVLAPIIPDVFNVPADERPMVTRLVLLMGAGMGITITCGIPRAIFRGLQRFDIANLIAILFTISTAASTVLILLLDGGLLAMVAGNIAIMLALQVPSIWLIHQIAPELRFRWRGASKQLVRTVFSFSSSLFVMHLAGRVQTKTDEIVIAAFLPLSAVTPYAIALKLSEVGQILTDQFMKVLAPLASELHAEDDRFRLRALYVISSRLTLAIFLPIACTLVVLTRPILTAWVGEAYASYAYLVEILTFASLIETSQWPAMSVLQGMGRHRPLAMMWVGAAVANLGLSVTLVHVFGLAGVALGTLFPTTVVCLVFVLPYAMRVMEVRLSTALKEIFLPPILAAVPMAIILYILQQAIEASSLLGILLVTAIGFMVYMATYLSLTAGELERQIWRNFAHGSIRFAEAYRKSS